MAREKLTTLRSRLSPRAIRVEKRTMNEGASNVYDMLAFVAPNGRTLMTVNVDDLFDGDGNRFEDNL